MPKCTTCFQSFREKHDCPGIGDIQVSRQLGRGLIVDTAPPRALMNLALLADHGYGLTMQGNDLINLADQVLYQVVGYDPETASLILELVEDWRPAPTIQVPLTEEQRRDIESRWREAYGKPGGAHPTIVLDKENTDG